MAFVLTSVGVGFDILQPLDGLMIAIRNQSGYCIQ